LKKYNVCGSHGMGTFDTDILAECGPIEHEDDDAWTVWNSPLCCATEQ